MNEQTIAAYLTELGKKEGKPGGGSAAAYIGAMSASLARLTSDVQKDKKAYRDFSDDLYDLLDEAQEASREFEHLAQADSEAFEPVLEAYQLPKETSEEKEIRNQTIEAALLGAAQPPLRMLEVSLELLAILEQLVYMRMQGTIVNDLLVATIFIGTVLETALLNVYINTKLFKDQSKRDEIEEKADQLVSKGKERVHHLSDVTHYFLKHDTWPDDLMAKER
ncbi:cyclodeaminase/cyclohydrolase family protein [Alkalibacterium iburiense]|uniref:Cyclodeaminase/cyclohydrolase family protein n=1 Tax=Alkalibacterium iburiense TaxID=290589 RepID=A0ABP3H8P4_9LACT